MESLAASMTLNIRTRANAGPGAAGTTYTTETVVVVLWEWAIFLMALVIAAFLFVVTVVLDTRKQGMQVWKGNPLPLLCHGLEDGLKEGHGALKSIYDMKEVAEGLEVVLVSEQDRWRLEKA